MLKSLRHLSIQQKLTVSMAACLLLFILVSGGLGAWLVAKAVRERVVDEDLPTAVGRISADVERRIAEPLAAARAVADNHYVKTWEQQGLPASGESDWKAYAQSVKQLDHAASVFWVSKDTGKYYTDQGMTRTLTAKDTWFTSFLAGGKPYSLEIDRENGSTPFMLFINVRAQTAAGKLAVAGLGLDVDALAKAVGGYKIAQTGRAYLVRSNGTIMMDADPALVDGKHLLSEMPGWSPALAQQLMGSQPFAQVRVSGADGARFLATSFVPELDAYVVCEVPEEELLGPVDRAIRIATLLAALIGGSVSLLIIVLVSRATARPVKRAAALLDEIASGKGDLTRRMVVESDDEVGQLAQAFNRFVSSLSELVKQVRTSGDSIATGSSQIAAGNADLSQRTEQQASNLQQTAASMEQLTVTVRHNADNAAAAARIVSGAASSAAKGGAVVRDVVQTMSQITANSNRIAEIVGVVDGIAFQTNILALNAAVEAARAGEEGRGFAVVAGEVRSLAQRSATAAREIKSLIQRSVENVETGAQQVAAAGNTMDEIVDQVGRVNDLVSEISAASNQQSQGIVLVGEAVTQLDQTTQQNTALVEESAAAAESLKHQAAVLAELMSAFSVD